MTYIVTPALPPETSQQLRADSFKLFGSTTVCGIFYGFMTVLAAACIHAFFCSTSLGEPSRRRLAVQVGYVALLWICGTLYMAGLARMTQDAYVTRRLQLQSPEAWSDFQMPEDIIADASYSVANCLADGLLIWRFRAVWHNSKWYRYLLPFPVFLYLGVIGLFIMTTVSDSMPGRSFYSPDAYKISIPGFIVSVVLNIYTTSLIAGRLYIFRRWLVKTAGRHFLHPKHFTNIAGIAIESCALLTATAIAFIATYLARHPVEYVMIAVLAQVQIIAPLLVVYRISWGIAWRADTDTELHTSSGDGGGVLQQRDTDSRISVISCLKAASRDSVEAGHANDINV